MKTSFPRMHVSLYVSDIQKTISFYNQLFKQSPSKVKTAYAKYELSLPSLIISFVENKDKVQPYFGHLGFQLGSEKELNEQLEHFTPLGMVSLVEQGTACCYAIQDKFWLTDPDGVKWEIYYFHEDVEFNDPHYANEDAVACCAPLMRSEKKRVKLSDL